MKENFVVSVINTRTQSRSTVTSNAETLGQLKADLMNAGIDYQGMTFMEGSTKTELKDDSSILPTNVPVKKNGTATGETTNNLVFFLTSPEKHIASGLLVADRKAAYSFLKEHPMFAKEFATRFGKNYTNGSTKDLLDFINSSVKPEAKATKKTVPVKKSAVKEEVDDYSACNIGTKIQSYIVKCFDNGLVAKEVVEGIAAILDGKEAPEVKVGYSDSDIDAMYGEWMKK